MNEKNFVQKYSYTTQISWFSCWVILLWLTLYIIDFRRKSTFSPFSCALATLFPLYFLVCFVGIVYAVATVLSRPQSFDRKSSIVTVLPPSIVVYRTTPCYVSWTCTHCVSMLHVSEVLDSLSEMINELNVVSEWLMCLCEQLTKCYYSSNAINVGPLTAGL